LLMFCSIFLNFLFISLNSTFIAFFTISVDSNTTCRKQRYRSRVAAESHDVTIVTWCN
jgi:hypothetical protein